MKGKDKKDVDVLEENAVGANAERLLDEGYFVSRHLEEFRLSGLSDNTILKAEIKSVNAMVSSLDFSNELS